MAVIPPRSLPTPQNTYTPTGTGGDFIKGTAAGVLGLPADVLQLMNAVWAGQAKRPMSDIPFTSDDLGRMMGADITADSFFAGTVGAPDPKDLGKALLAASKNPALAMTLFHGTLHKFDKFSLDAIGTGEGAQAFGHGLYFAESPGVARSYQHSLAQPAKITDDVKQALARNDNAGFDSAAEALNDFRRHDDWAERWDILPDDVPTIQAQLDKPQVSSHLYEVEIPDEVTDRMLDWHKPLSEQPESIKEMASNFLREEGYDFPANELSDAFEDWAQHEVGLGVDEHGKLLYDLLADKMGGQEAASQALREAGIPGIKYRAGSLSGGAGETDNIVLFDPEDIIQVKRDGDVVMRK